MITWTGEIARGQKMATSVESNLVTSKMLVCAHPCRILCGIECGITVVRIMEQFRPHTRAGGEKSVRCACGYGILKCGNYVPQHNDELSWMMS